MDQQNSTLFHDLEQSYVMQIGGLCLKIYASLLLLVGIPANIICGIIMGGNRSNRMTTRFLMIVLSIADSAVLLVAVLRYWTMRVLKWDPRLLGPTACKLHTFSVGCSTDYAVGALCALAVERLLVVAFPHKANSIVNMCSVTFGMGSFGLLVVAKNMLIFWLVGSTKPGFIDRTNMSLPMRIGTSDCTPLPEYRHIFKIFTKVDLVSFAVLPYIILFSSNLFIYVKLRNQQALLRRAKPKSSLSRLRRSIREEGQHPVRNEPLSTDGKAITNKNRLQSTLSRSGTEKRPKRRPDGVIKLLTALTLIHVICTLPGTLFTFITSYPKNLVSIRKDVEELLKSGLVMLVFTNNAINFFGYYASSTAFRESFCGMFRCDWHKSVCQQRLFSQCGCRCVKHKQTSGSEFVQLVVTPPGVKVASTRPTERERNMVNSQGSLKESPQRIINAKVDSFQE
ncbi:hypothetical protein CSKR_110786 [Clonorchis sinensis]|uniref:G-protein coupled receptors family 1 profile domain-containing protein n=2 Tax=Clonorchis sinensis TaxID=79923 RepID=A0A3R7JY41_CLOSI|nr:hypothetical protein CSKR_110786 [Clonorchis sinensis]